MEQKTRIVKPKFKTVHKNLEMRKFRTVGPKFKTVQRKYGGTWEKWNCGVEVTNLHAILATINVVAEE